MKPPAEDSVLRQYSSYVQDWLLPLLRSPALREEYREYRHRGLATYVRFGGAMLLLLIYLLIVFSSWLFYPVLPEQDARLWVAGSALVAIMATIPLVLAQFSRFRRHYDLIAIPFSAVIITKFAVAAQLYVHPEAAIAEGYFCMLAILIITLSMRLSLLAVIGCLLLCLILTASMVLWLVPIADIRWERMSFYFLITGAVCGMIAVLQDVSQSTSFRLSRLVDEQAEALRRLALEDALTGLTNRRGFDNLLKQEWLHHRRQQHSLGVLFIDVDHFKAYNDHYGHEAGDHCLQHIAEAVQGSLKRANDSAARYGGEEFVVLLADINENGAHEVAERILRNIDGLALAHEGMGEGKYVTVSIGVAADVPSDATEASVLLRRADEALYRAKREGRHRIALALPVATGDPVPV